MTGLLIFTGANLGLTLVATVLVVVFAPTAAGPGIPEIKAYLNGVDTPNMFGATTMIVKVCFLDLVDVHEHLFLFLFNSPNFGLRSLEVLEQLQLDLILAKKALWFTLEAA